MALSINPAVARVDTPPIPQAARWLEEAKTSRNEPLLDLAQAVPSYDPAPELLDHMGAVARDPASAFYTPILGLPALREAQAAALSNEYGAAITPAETAITTGCNHAFCMATAAVAGTGDEIILPEPFYFNHDMWFTMQGIRQVPLPCRAEAEGMVPDPVEAESLITPRTRAIVLVSPNNPSGTIYTAGRLEAFYRLAERRGLALILDETYKDFRPGGEGGGAGAPHNLFQDAGWREVLIQLYSFSKAYSLTGYRVGSLVAGGRVMEAVSKIADTITICPPHVGQLAALYGLEHLEAWREEKRDIVLGLIETLDRAFETLAPAYRMVSRGAFFAYLQHPYPGRSSVEVAKGLARDQGLLVLPGEFFGASQTDFLRVAFANAGPDELEDFVGRLFRALCR